MNRVPGETYRDLHCISPELLAGQVEKEVRRADGADEEGEAGSVTAAQGPVRHPFEQERHQASRQGSSDDADEGETHLAEPCLLAAAHHGLEDEIAGETAGHEHFTMSEIDQP